MSELEVTDSKPVESQDTEVKIDNDSVEETQVPITLEDLEALIISDDYEVTQAQRLQALTDHRVLSTKLPSEWSLQQVQSFLEMGIEPAKTSNGVWVEDVERANKKAGAWSEAEVVAWAKGEIKATGRATDNALAQSLISRFGLKVKGNSPEEAIKAYLFKVEGATVAETSTAASEKLEEQVDNNEVKDDVQSQLSQEGLTPMDQRFIEITLNNYIERVKPGKAITREEGIHAQKALDGLLKYIVALKDPVGFKSAMDYLMGEIVKHREGGVFDDTYALRFTDGLPTGGNVQENHNRLLTLFFIFADKDKSFRKQADISVLIEFVPGDKQPLIRQYFEQYP